MRRRWALVLVLAVVAVGTAAIVRRLASDARIPFLWPYAPAAWIVAPAPLDLRAKRPLPVTAAFVRDLDLADAPPTARLRLRAFRRARVQVNGDAVLATAGDDWKSPAEADVASRLRAGANRIEVVVENDVGPPALWLALELPSGPVVSDEAWRVSRAGGSELPAALASRAPQRPAADGLAVAPDLVRALRTAWPDLALLFALGALATFAAARLARRPSGEAAELAERLLFLVVVGAWCALALGAQRWLPLTTGFDAEGHLEYVERVRASGTLPLADQGWQMYHPPLYYAAQAALLRAAGATVFDAAGAWCVRALDLALGVVCLLFAARSLRLLFPASPRGRIYGLLFVAFLPVQLYVLQYPGNEALAIALGSVCFYACLRVLRAADRGYRGELLLGLALGAALLAKQSALLLALPMLLVVLWHALVRADGGARRALAALAAVGGAMLLVCGWHYARVALRFGDPLVANWDGRAGPRWWQDPGFRTPYDFVHVSRALLEPYFAAADGLVAGLYASLWSDAFAGGVADLQGAPPWRHELLVLGPLLGVPLGVALALGWVASSVRAARLRDPAWGLAPLLVAVAVAAAMWIGLAVPHVSIAKASYVIIVAAPLAVLAALGLERLAGSSAWRGAVVTTLLAGWALTSFATYLVPGAAPATLAFAGRTLLGGPRHDDGVVLLREALAADPTSWVARVSLATAAPAGPEAAALAEDLARADTRAPAGAQLALGRVLLRAGRDDEARAALLRAADDHALLAPRLELAVLAARRGDDQEAERWARAALALSPVQPGAHAVLADVYARSDRAALADAHRAWVAGPDARAAR